jgi:biopolymer transport protein ExbD
MRIHTEEEVGVSFQLAPMIDVIFMLLTFFIVAGSYKQTETELRVQLPERAEGKPPALLLQVEISKEGVITSDQGEVFDEDPSSHELPKLRQRLHELVRIDAEVPVTIRPSGDTLHQRVMDVLNACHGMGVKNVAFTAPQDVH